MKQIFNHDSWLGCESANDRRPPPPPPVKVAIGRREGFEQFVADADKNECPWQEFRQKGYHFTQPKAILQHQQQQHMQAIQFQHRRHFRPARATQTFVSTYFLHCLNMLSTSVLVSNHNTTIQLSNKLLGARTKDITYALANNIIISIVCLCAYYSQSTGHKYISFYNPNT